ncbi:lysoplasmalogenase [Caulobacter sp. D4A]|uniref:lysoplasmalogenase n=1 Tax=unclassified Caulobacter TaxID=2648921 RepID=UPI000D72F49B|nr:MULTISPECIES: lysoplasmalogenase [unclassified Caulobacter]PXA83108.1 lysoplasmalogenase [Caulobacter sp. D4A]PXA96662.1 lysoplasmalogenase [Caulobacter sp. D5]
MTDTLLWAICGVCALAYGFVLVERPPSFVRTVVKAAATGALAVLAYLEGGTVLLAVALTLCALGDVFLAGDPKRWLPYGLAAFLAGHVVYVIVFWRERTTPSQAFFVIAPVAALVGAVMLRRLWGSLGPLRPAVLAYVAAILAMVVSAAALPTMRWPATAGAVAFMASDAILAFDLFKGAKLFGSARLTAWAVWFLYIGGQAAIAWGMLR